MKLIYLIVIVILNLVYKCSSMCTSAPVYGREPCAYVPAPPGRVPTCARPGLTYCEHPTHYPGQLIQHLLEKWKFDHATLLADESRDEFNSYFISSDNHYDINNIYGYNSIQPQTYSPEPIYIPKPQFPTKLYPNTNTFVPSSVQNATGFAGYPDRRPPYFSPTLPNPLLGYKYSKNPFLHSQYPTIESSPNIYKAFGHPQINHYNPNDWWKNFRYARDEKYQQQLRKKRSAHMRNLRKRFVSVDYSLNGTSTTHVRRKRQSAITGQTLCESQSQHIMPRAALNNQGNWMYVVNMPELDNRYTQLVKSETCISQQCNGLCSLPAGYSSRCEQKYVQKRLVALNGGGNELYTDVFWFPHCCICTISNS